MSNPPRNGPPNEVGPRPEHHFRTEDTDTNRTLNATASIVTRCRRCGRPLSAARSLLLGAGPVCRRHIFDGELVTAVTNCADDDLCSSARIFWSRLAVAS
jgi:ribosomal protein S14